MSEKSGGTVSVSVPNVSAYLATIALVVLMALVTVVVIVERGGADEETLIVHVIAFTAPTVAALLAVMKSAESVATIKGVHVDINGRMGQLLELTAAQAHAEGVKVGMGEGALTTATRSGELHGEPVGPIAAVAAETARGVGPDHASSSLPNDPAAESKG